MLSTCRHFQRELCLNLHRLFQNQKYLKSASLLIYALFTEAILQKHLRRLVIFGLLVAPFVGHCDYFEYESNGCVHSSIRGCCLTIQPHTLLPCRPCGQSAGAIIDCAHSLQHMWLFHSFLPCPRLFPLSSMPFTIKPKRKTYYSPQKVNLTSNFLTQILETIQFGILQ